MPLVSSISARESTNQRPSALSRRKGKEGADEAPGGRGRQGQQLLRTVAVALVKPHAKDLQATRDRDLVLGSVHHEGSCERRRR
jgi:hypothetical protein